MKKAADTIRRERVLDAADELFSVRGYASVTLRDIAAKLGIHHASLYYYAPGGKEELYLEVMERNLERHRIGIQQSVMAASGNLRNQLRATGNWLFSQPLLDMARMTHADAKQLGDRGDQLLWKAYECFTQALMLAFQQAEARGELDFADHATAAISFVTLVEGLHSVPVHLYAWETRESAFEKLLDLFMHGVLRRDGPSEPKTAQKNG